MAKRAPYFVLYSGSNRQRCANGRWRFSLCTAEGRHLIDAEDKEHDVADERLELLSVVRGLEAIDNPSRVTVLTPSRYVYRGMRFGLSEWRGNEWRWEHYGRLVPIKDPDLWQRVDRAMKIHDVDFRLWRFDGPHTPAGKDANVRRSIRVKGSIGPSFIGRLKSFFHRPISNPA